MLFVSILDEHCYVDLVLARVRKVVVQDEAPVPEEGLPAPLPANLETQLSDRLRSVLDAQLAAAESPATAPLVVEDV